MTDWQCPRCSSGDLRRAALLYAQGTSRTEGTSRSIGLGTFAGRLGIGGSTSSHSSVSQDDLARLLAPPVRRHSTSQFATVAGWAFLLFGLVMIAGQEYWMGSILTISGAFISVGLPLQRRASYRRALASWERLMVCMRCGTSFEMTP